MLNIQLMYIMYMILEMLHLIYEN